MIPTGSIVNVKVSGFPRGGVKMLPYRASYPVSDFEDVEVPAPGWVQRATGAVRLPGVVLGLHLGPLNVLHAHLVNILPRQADTERAAAREAITRWRDEAARLREEASTYERFASLLENSL